MTDVKHDKDGDGYTLELTVYPLDTLETTYDQVVEYIEAFNARVDEGDYNNTTEVDYETEFAEGIIDILEKTVDNPGYMDPVVLEIPIQPSDDYYYISDEDFLKIDENILYIRENDDSALPTEDTQTDGEAGTETENTEAGGETDTETESTETEAATE